MHVLHDDRRADPGQVTVVDSDGDDIGLMDYVALLNDAGEEWVGQVVVPNLNISLVGSPLEPSILRGLELRQSRPDVLVTKFVRIYAVQILGQKVDGGLSIARFRPTPGAKVRKLDDAETRALICLPPAREDGANVIGILLNARGVPLAVSWSPDHLVRHTLVNGGSGSGKSNVVGNYVDNAQGMGKCVFIHDVKPDYQYCDRPNTDPLVGGAWEKFRAYGKTPRGLQNVLSVGFQGLCDADRVDRVLGFHASDFPPDLLAGLIFEPGDSSVQVDGFVASAQHVKDSGRRPYSFDDILDECRRRDASAPNPVQPQDQINTLALGAILRKVNQRRRFLPWIDAVGRPIGRRAGLGGGVNDESRSVQRCSFGELVASGRIVRVHYGSLESDNDYALLLWWFLSEGHGFRKGCTVNRTAAPGLFQVIDEAHRIFSSEGRHVHRLAKTFHRVTFEGRSMDHAILLSLQNASHVPSDVLNNINTHIVMKQNNAEVARVATQKMPKEFAQQAMRLHTGQAIVQMQDAHAPVLCEMCPSPFELMRTDNT
jgi:hypothetical protein